MLRTVAGGAEAPSMACLFQAPTNFVRNFATATLWPNVSPPASDHAVALKTVKVQVDGFIVHEELQVSSAVEATARFPI
jgi:hypothetical protein